MPAQVAFALLVLAVAGCAPRDRAPTQADLGACRAFVSGVEGLNLLALANGNADELAEVEAVRLAITEALLAADDERFKGAGEEYKAALRDTEASEAESYAAVTALLATMAPVCEEFGVPLDGG